MKVYVCAHIGIYGKHTTDALEILNKKPTDSSFIKFPLFDYLTGLAKLNSLDSDAASYFKMFLAENKGENHIKSSYQKIAWCYLLKNDTLNYFHFIEKALKKGDNLLDIDKQALFEAQSHQVPNINLLRARLLFDGGYFQKASDEMNLISLNSFIKIEDQTEFLYRSGRIYDEWNKPDTALIFYSKAIEKGKDLPRFFAANAAFESGKIYEAKGDKEKAKYYYTLCMSFENHEYKNGIDQKAKAGLNRLK